VLIVLRPAGEIHASETNAGLAGGAIACADLAHHGVLQKNATCRAMKTVIESICHLIRGNNHNAMFSFWSPHRRPIILGDFFTHRQLSHPLDRTFTLTAWQLPSISLMICLQSFAFGFLIHAGIFSFPNILRSSPIGWAPDRLPPAVGSSRIHGRCGNYRLPQILRASTPAQA